MTVDEFYASKSIKKISRITDDTYIVDGNMVKISDNPGYIDIINEMLLVDGGFEELNSMFISSIETHIQELLDNKAKEKGYDSILSACTYAISRGRFQIEGTKFAEWRTDVWDYCYSELDSIKKGIKPIPTLDGFLSSIPQLIL